MELERNGSSGVAKAGLTTGIIGTVLSTLGILGGGAGLLSGLGGITTKSTTNTVDTVVVPVPMAMNGGMPVAMTPGTTTCSEDHTVNRYELDLVQKLAQKDSEIALRDANTYNDQKMLDMYKYVDGRFQEFEQALANQAVTNQATKDSFQLVRQEADCCCKELKTAIAAETKERRCADNTIVTYVNGTFYPKSVADVTVGTTTTPQALYNPLPIETCGCGN